MGVVMHMVRLFCSQITEGITEVREAKVLTVTHSQWWVKHSVLG